MREFFDNIGAFFEANPGYIGLLVCAFGLFVLVGAIRNWKIIFENQSAPILRKPRRMFMRKEHLRKVVGGSGVLLILLGIAWFALHFFS
jgi:hypothetical protein